MNTINFKVPANFEMKSFVRKLHDLSDKYAKKGTKVSETYGSMAKSYIGNARTSKHLYDVNLSTIKEYILESKQYGIDFNYVINASWSNGLEFTKEGKESVLNEIGELVDIGVHKVTICSPSIIQIIKKYFSNLEICLSTNLYISSVHELQRWGIEGINKVVLNRHINRDLKLLESLSRNSNMELELLINSMCNLHCSLRYYHNLANCVQSNITSDEFDTYFPQIKCTKYNLSNLIETICCAWVRPEDVHYYFEKFGIKCFKIDGRSLDADSILFITESYLGQRLDGNFFDLFDFFNTRQNLGVNLYLDNRELDDFLDGIRSSGIDCRLCGGSNKACKDVANKIIIKNEKSAKIYSTILENNTRNMF